MELVVVAAAVMIIMAMALPLTQNLVLNYRANAAMDQVVMMMRDARHSAISDSSEFAYKAAALLLLGELEIAF